MDPNKPEIQREIPVSFIITGDKQKNGTDNNLNKEGSQAENQTEYTIKVYTGDKRGTGTDANVHIILFGDEDKSEVFHLSQSLEHQDPFERGKVRIKISACFRIGKVNIKSVQDFYETSGICPLFHAIR